MINSQNYIEVPNEYSDLNTTLKTANKIMGDAVINAKTLFHTPVVSSFYNDNVYSRVMVLREYCFKDKFMRFHTDNRSEKIDIFRHNNSSNIIGYDPSYKIQIKFQGKITIHYNDEVTKNAWNESTSRSKKCYSVKDGSSQKIKNPEDYDIKDFNVEEGYKNFAVLKFHFKNLEFLYLKSSGHRRAFHCFKDQTSSTWLIP